MPMRFDSTYISGLFDIDGYIELSQYTAEEVADLILQRLQQNITVDTPREKGLDIPPNRLSKEVQILYNKIRKTSLISCSFSSVSFLPPPVFLLRYLGRFSASARSLIPNETVSREQPKSPEI
jgi:hypothetical protein